MNERPILFSGPMARAILEGRKTQTRRIVSDSYIDAAPPVHFHRYLLEHCPYGQPGDRLWVRETCRAKELTDDEAVQRCKDDEDCEDAEYGLDGVLYLADNAFVPIEDTPAASDKWCALNAYRGQKGAIVPAIHMPRWASRITLEIISVRVQRLQDISPRDADAEGVKAAHDEDHLSHQWCAVEEYQRLWDSINAKRAPWASNPWVWVVEFKRLGI